MIFVVHDLNPRALSPKVHGFVQAQNWFQDLTPITSRHESRFACLRGGGAGHRARGRSHLLCAVAAQAGREPSPSR